MFGKLASALSRKAKRATPSRHKAKFYDLRISGVEPEVTRVRMGWILGKGRPAQWCVQTSCCVKAVMLLRTLKTPTDLIMQQYACEFCHHPCAADHAPCIHLLVGGCFCLLPGSHASDDCVLFIKSIF
jgi:hypothetical protein